MQRQGSRGGHVVMIVPCQHNQPTMAFHTTVNSARLLPDTCAVAGGNICLEHCPALLLRAYPSVLVKRIAAYRYLRMLPWLQLALFIVTLQ